MKATSPEAEQKRLKERDGKKKIERNRSNRLEEGNWNKESETPRGVLKGDMF